MHNRFCYIAGTGRTATHWIKHLVDSSCDRSKVATFHDGFPKRAKVGQRPHNAAFFLNYLGNLDARQPGKETYVECNPALLEHVALTYGIANALAVIPAGLLEQPARALLITRHPYTYAASLKARGWGWQWWNYPKAHEVFNIGTDFSGRPMVEQAAIAWACKNAFAHELLRSDNCLWLKYEFLFDYRVSRARYLERTRSILSHFGLEPTQSDGFLWRLRDQRSAIKNVDRITLTAAEKRTVKAICAPVMELYEYA